MKHKEFIRKIILFIMIILFFIFGILLYAWLNFKYKVGFPCVLNQAFGIYCSGCGLTRAGIALLQLDFYQAFRYNAFSLIFIPGIFFVAICFIWESIFRKTSFISKIPVWIWVSLVITFLVYGIIRNFVPYLQPINL